MSISTPPHCKSELLLLLSFVRILKGEKRRPLYGGTSGPYIFKGTLTEEASVCKIICRLSRPPGPLSVSATRTLVARSNFPKRQGISLGHLTKSRGAGEDNEVDDSPRNQSTSSPYCQPMLQVTWTRGTSSIVISPTSSFLSP